MVWPELIIIFFLIALIYSAAGFGGGSSYLAVLALYDLPYTAIRSTALLCNIAVVSQSTVSYARSGLLRWRRVLPLVLTSVPMAFVGGMWPLKARTFYLLLGTALLMAALLMVWRMRRGAPRATSTLPAWSSPLIGGAIGLLSGLVGIGGGIFLSPVLHLTGWDTPRRIAATTSLFILLNSMAGLAGQILNPDFRLAPGLTPWLVLAVLLGGILGTRFTIHKASPATIRGITAVLITLVAIRLLWRYA